MVDGAGGKGQEDMPLLLAWPWACSLGLAEEQQLPLLCLRLRATTRLPLPWASPDDFLLLQASALLSVKDNLGESDHTFLMPEASQLQPVLSL